MDTVPFKRGAHLEAAAPSPAPGPRIATPPSSGTTAPAAPTSSDGPRTPQQTGDSTSSDPAAQPQPTGYTPPSGFAAPTQERKALPDPPGWYDGVQIIDTPTKRVHHPSDIVSMVAGVLGIALVILVTIYAHETTQGVTHDVRSFGAFLRQLLFVPVSALVTFVTAIAPLIVITEMAVQRLARQIVEAIAAALVGVGLGYGALWLLQHIEAEFTTSFEIGVGSNAAPSLPIWATPTVALLIVAGPRGRRTSVRWSWNALWVTLTAVFITGQVTLPGAIVGVLLGTIAGHLVRWASGVASERAYGMDLIEGIRRAGFDPSRLVRIRDVAEEDIAAAHPALSDATLEEIADPAAMALTRFGDNRVYAMTVRRGTRYDLVVLDGDRQVMGTLARWWRSVRLRGIEGRSVLSLRQAAERAALLSMAADKAGVRTPELLAIASAHDSMLLIAKHPGQVTSLRDVPDADLDDDVLDAIWRQIKTAHDAGLAHRALSGDVVLVGPAVLGAPDQDGQRRYYGAATTRLVDEREVWLTGWEYGDVASSGLAQRMDIAAMLSLLGLRVGPERAVASAVRVLGLDTVATAGPLVQVAVLPRSTRDLARKSKQVLADIRSTIIGLAPEADVEPEPVVRVGAKTLFTWLFALVAVVVVVTTINFQQIVTTIRQAQPLWAAAAFGLGLVTFVGAAISLVAFSPVKLPLWRAIKVQVAGAFVALVAPAGVGPAALNLRMLTKIGVATPLAVASVSIVQVSQLVTTLALLLVLGLFGGGGGILSELPSTTVLLVTLGLAVLIAVAMFIPALRTWVVSRVRPMLVQTWPRLVAMLSQPRRLLLAVAGNLIMTVGYIVAFQACVLAFGRQLAWIDVALIYLVGNAAGAAAPTPGGLGAIELAFIGQLTAAGMGVGLATSIAMLFRVLTYWGRIPLGWIAMRHLQKRNQL